MRDISSPGDVIFQKFEFTGRLVHALQDSQQAAAKLQEEIDHTQSTLPSLLPSTAPHHRSFPARMVLQDKRIRVATEKFLEEFYVDQLEERGCTVGNEALAESGDLFEYGE